MYNDKNEMPQELNDSMLDETNGGTRTTYGNVPNRRTADLKCSVCGRHIIYSDKSSFKTVGGKIICRNCSK